MKESPCLYAAIGNFSDVSNAPEILSTRGVSGVD